MFWHYQKNIKSNSGMFKLVNIFCTTIKKVVS
jgi:hypothetical protein